MVHIRQPLNPGDSLPLHHREGDARARSVLELGQHPPASTSNLYEVYDRAHFPTVPIEVERAATDPTPLPLFPGRQVIGPERPGAPAAAAFDATLSLGS